MNCFIPDYHPIKDVFSLHEGSLRRLNHMIGNRDLAVIEPYPFRINCMLINAYYIIFKILLSLREGLPTRDLAVAHRPILAPTLSSHGALQRYAATISYSWRIGRVYAYTRGAPAHAPRLSNSSGLMFVAHGLCHG
jgi:hypothetical protein